LAVIEVDRLMKIFPPKVVALDNVTFSVESGEFLAVLGPSGSGKTTLIRIIAGLERPTKGRVIIDGEVVADGEKGFSIPPQKRNVGMVFQTWALYPNMKVFDNIAFPLDVKGLSKEEIRKRVVEVAKYLEIDDLLDRYPRQLSGGQQQRVALARALVKNPRILLLDEPFSNLDARVRITAREFVKKIQRSLGMTTILVTHDQADAFAVGDRILVIDKGRIQQLGNPTELYNEPVNMFVAGFIGEPPMVFNELRVENGVIEIIKIKLGDLKEGRVIIGVRPDEAIAVLTPPTEGHVALIKGVVEVSEYLGARQYVVVRSGKLSLRALALTEKQLSRGTEVYISIRKVHVFNSDDGKRLASITGF
jgi:carbohydrate ABC transporter ATP-binding protein, CUT1 family (TC 3.A.1.1.-)